MWGISEEAIRSGDTISSSLPRSESNGEMLARLIDYTRSIETDATGLHGGSRQTAA